MTSIWQHKPSDPQQVRALAQACHLDAFTSQLLLHRGLCNAKEVRRFLNPRLEALEDPFALPDIERALSRIQQALTGHESILVFGDSDVDGLTASAIVFELLRACGAQVSTRISNRIEDGYGIPEGLIEELGPKGIRLLIVVDTGTNHPEQIRQLKAQGIDTIILDHHLPVGEAAHPYAMVNPHLVKGIGQELCSAGLAFKLAQAWWAQAGASGRVRRHRGDIGENVTRYLDLAALATLADCAPLVGDSRILVVNGLPRVLESHRPGLRQLCAAVKLLQPNPNHISRRVIPPLNAPGRLGDASPVLALLVETDEAVAAGLLETVRGAHQQSKLLHRRILGEAFEQASRIHFKDQSVMVVGRRGWHPGLMGPIASQLVDRYARPAIAIAIDGETGRGSGRAPGTFNLFEALRACEGILLRYGGHARACGLTLELNNLEALRDQLNHQAATAQETHALRRTLAIDLELSLSQVTPERVAACERFAPFGVGNPKPMVLVRDLVVAHDRTGAGQVTDGHTRLKVRGRRLGLLAGESYDVVASLSRVGEDPVLSLCEARLSDSRP